VIAETFANRPSIWRDVTTVRKTRIGEIRQRRVNRPVSGREEMIEDGFNIIFQFITTGCIEAK